ncbi:hypothetical protein I4U23_013705 [Adineta vaga]|nr:hypothetical protein I4U23_013705 [Adineta vaga]
MDYSHYLNDFIFFIINDIKYIFLPTGLASLALYIPIFLLSIFNRSIFKISKWILTSSIVLYLLLLPTYSFIRSVPVFNACIAGLAIYYAQKVCEWILIRRNEFSQWSFFDIQHELFYYRVYIQAVPIKKLKKKEIFFSGPIQFDQHLYSLIYLSRNIIKYYLLLDLTIFLINEVVRTEFYEKYLSIQMFVNLLSGCIVYFYLSMNYEMFRHSLCLLFNRPLALIPDLFHKPYLAVSPIDFWSRWHQIFKNTWLELIFKPTSTFIRYHFPHLPKSIIYGISSMCVFLFSGLIHEYFVYITFNKFSGDQIKFFLYQGFAVVIEHAFKQQFPHLYIWKPFGFILTFVFNGIIASYFLQPWIPFFQRKHAFKYSLINLVIRNILNKY